MALDVPPGYRALKEADVAAYLAGVPAVAASLGGQPADWKVREVGDGNLNLVFVVEGPTGGVVLKQALPYVRLVGESWPLPAAPRLLRASGAQRRSARWCRRTCRRSSISTRPWRSP